MRNRYAMSLRELLAQLERQAGWIRYDSESGCGLPFWVSKARRVGVIVKAIRWV